MRIATFITDAGSWGSVNLETLEKGLGGRETAALQLSIKWAEAGHDAWLFAPNDQASEHFQVSGGDGELHIIDKAGAIPLLTAMQWDALVSWEDPRIFAVPGVRDSAQVMLCGMQVAHPIHNDPEMMRLADAYVALSPWHKTFLEPQLPRGMKIAVMPNCTDLSRFEEPHAAFREEQIRFLYASSPDRGLVHLLRAWPRLREQLPGCTLDVAYAAGDWARKQRWSHHHHGEIAVDILVGLAQDGITDRGRIGATALAKLHLNADALLYPCDTIQPTETGCITIIEALAAGTPVVTTDADCLLSEFSQVTSMLPLPYDEGAYVDTVVELMNRMSLRREFANFGKDFAQQRDWAKVAPKWITIMERLGVQERARALA